MFYKDITLLMMLKLIILLCWCCYALLNGVSTSCLNVVNTRLKVFKQCFMCLFLFSRCLPFAKKFNHLVYLDYDVVENIFLVNDLINILFAVCKLFVWISASCWDVAKKFNHLVYDIIPYRREYILCKCIQRFKSVWSEFTLIEWKYFCDRLLWCWKKKMFDEKYFRCSCSTAARLPSPK